MSARAHAPHALTLGTLSAPPCRVGTPSAATERSLVARSSATAVSCSIVSVTGITAPPAAATAAAAAAAAAALVAVDDVLVIDVTARASVLLVVAGVAATLTPSASARRESEVLLHKPAITHRREH
jgi:hypothetical protein